MYIYNTLSPTLIYVYCIHYAEQLTSKLLNGMGRTESEDVQKECLDNMADLLQRYHTHDVPDFICIRQHPYLPYLHPYPHLRQSTYTLCSLLII
jgi:hypothetical protein